MQHQLCWTTTSQSKLQSLPDCPQITLSLGNELKKVIDMETTSGPT